MAFVSMNFRAKSGRGRSLEYNEFTVNRKKCCLITFSQGFSNTLREEGMEKADFMRDDITGEIGIAFGLDEGLRLIGKSRDAGGSYHNLCVSNKQAVEWIFSQTGIKGDYAVLQMTNNLSINPGVRFHKIIGIKR